MRSDRVLNFEFMSGDRTFKRQTNRTFNSQNDRGFSLINKMTAIALSHPQNSDRGFKVKV
jgi:hypothetical protein